MEETVLQQIIPNFAATPGTFFRVLAITFAVILVAALQQGLIGKGLLQALRPGIDFTTLCRSVPTLAREGVAGLILLVGTFSRASGVTRGGENDPDDSRGIKAGLSQSELRISSTIAEDYRSIDSDNESPGSRRSSFELLANTSSNERIGIRLTSDTLSESTSSKPDQEALGGDVSTRYGGFTSSGRNGSSILPSYNQRAHASSVQSTASSSPRNTHRRARPPEDAISLQERDVRLRGDGQFIYICMGGEVFCRLIEVDAKEFDSDEAFLRELNRRCRSKWSQLWLLITMSASDQVHLKQFHFVSNGPVVRCSRTSSLPPDTHEQYRHWGPDVTCREDMILYHLQKYGERQWLGQPSGVAPERLYLDQERFILNAIPKKVPYRLEHRQGHEGWGIHISLRLCYFRLAICMAGWAAISAVSIALLLERKVGSLQDAVVPTGLSLTLFLFYVGLMAGLRK